MLKPLTAVLALAIVALIATAAGLTPAHAQTLPPAPTGLTATDSATPGQATVSWLPVDAAALYRISWASYDAVTAVQQAGRPWEDALAFTDVTNYGQTSHIIRNLDTGVRYAFIIASLNSRFGAASWSDWVFLTTAVTPPTAMPPPPPTPAPAPAPTPTLAPSPTPTPTPARIDYDADDDSLIEISNLTQLDAIRHDLDGNGISSAGQYTTAFPNAIAGMGCPAYGCAGYELVADLDFDTNANGQADAGDAYRNNGQGWTPIGENGQEPFIGNFDGNQHTIANLYINRPDDTQGPAGLFGVTSHNTIREIGLTAAEITGGQLWTGSLIGASHNTVVSASYATGSVHGNLWTGGLIGHAGNGWIGDSYTSITVTTTYATAIATGGLVGQASETEIVRTYATGTVHGQHDAGGLAGKIVCTGQSERERRQQGVFSSYATGNVHGVDDLGGLIGDSRLCLLNNTYATGSVTATHANTAGGLVGYQEGGNTSRSYATGAVTKIAEGEPARYFGGLIGNRYGGYVTSSFWDTETTGQSRSAGGIGRTTAQIQAIDFPIGHRHFWHALDWNFGTSRQYPVLVHAGPSIAAQRSQPD